MFDIQATIRWITAVLKTPDQAAADYKATSAPFMQTFMQITLPLYVGAYVVGGILAWILGGSIGFGELSAMGFIISLAFVLGWTFVVAFVFDLFAGMFGGVKNFDNAYATVALAVIPAGIGTVLGALPWIGWLLGLIASIYSLVLAWQFIPVFLAVPEANRVKHYAASVVTLLIGGLIVWTILGGLFVGAAVTSSVLSGGQRDTEEAVEDMSEDGQGPGFLGGMERSGEVITQAESDRYDPPADGKLTEEQVQTYIRNMEKTKALRDRLLSKYKAEEGKEGEEPSIGDVFGGLSDMTRAGTAETEVVKTSGGNWAEHVWVKNSIETARIQQDLNDAVKHNYELFLANQARIEALD